MKLYYSKGACSLAVRIAIHEMGIPCEFEAVNLKTKQTESGQDFYKITAKGAVPALLLDNQEVLTENAVIQQYLADSHQAKRLLPPVGDFNRYRVAEWLNFISTELHKGCSALFFSEVPEATKEKVFMPALINKLKFVDQHLSTHQFLLGNEFTLPDGYLFVILRWLRTFKLDISNLSALSLYFSELGKRASIQKSLQEEGLI